MKEDFSWDYSLKRNTINVFGPITCESAELIVSQLQYLDYKFRSENVPASERVITLQLNTPGGSVADGFAIMDTMNSISARIATVGLGMVASMGAVLLSAGTKGMRSVPKTARYSSISRSAARAVRRRTSSSPPDTSKRRGAGSTPFCPPTPDSPCRV